MQSRLRKELRWSVIRRNLPGVGMFESKSETDLRHVSAASSFAYVSFTTHLEHQGTRSLAQQHASWALGAQVAKRLVRRDNFRRFSNSRLRYNKSRRGNKLQTCVSTGFLARSCTEGITYIHQNNTPGLGLGCSNSDTPGILSSQDRRISHKLDSRLVGSTAHRRHHLQAH